MGILECVHYPFSRGPSQPKGQTQVSCIEGGFFTNWATKEVWSLKLHFLIHRKFLAWKYLLTGPNSDFQWYYIWGKSNSILITMVLFVWYFMVWNRIRWLCMLDAQRWWRLEGTVKRKGIYIYIYSLLYGRNQCKQRNYEPCHVGPPKTNGSWWIVLIKCSPLEKGMANHFSTLALRILWTVWKGKKIGHWKMDPQVSRCPICY